VNFLTIKKGTSGNCRLARDLGLGARAEATFLLFESSLGAETVDKQFTTVEAVAEVALFLAAFSSNALTGQSVCVSHGWHMS
jgi:3-hydroxybutyrate dehydrogenase